MCKNTVSLKKTCQQIPPAWPGRVKSSSTPSWPSVPDCAFTSLALRRCRCSSPWESPVHSCVPHSFIPHSPADTDRGLYFSKRKRSTKSSIDLDNLIYRTQVMFSVLHQLHPVPLQEEALLEPPPLRPWLSISRHQVKSLESKARRKAGMSFRFWFSF